MQEHLQKLRRALQLLRGDGAWETHESVSSCIQSTLSLDYVSLEDLESQIRQGSAHSDVHVFSVHSHG